MSGSAGHADPAASAPGAAPAGTARRDRRIILTLIVLAVLVTFGPVVTHDFAGGWDDLQLIVQDPLVNPPTSDALAKIWTTPHARMYIPAVYTTWWLLAHVATIPGNQPGTTTLNPYVYHAANLLIHLTNTLLVFAILRLLIRRDWPSAAGALVFALHPLQVEPVAWATGMKDLLSAMFALAALWQYLLFATDGSAAAGSAGATSVVPRRRRWVHYTIATAAFVLALLAKPSTVIVPVIALVLDTLLLRRPLRASAVAMLPWLVLAAAFAALTAKVQPTPELTAAPLAQWPLTAANALGFYVCKLVWPAKLGIDYGMRPERLARATCWIAAAAGAVLIAASRRSFVAAALIFALGVAPVLGFTPFVFQWLSTVADRYAYLSMLGAALAAAALLADVSRTTARRGAAIAAGTILVALAARSAAQVPVWSDARTLMEHALAVNPASPIAHNNLGDILARAGDPAGAEVHFAAAVKEKPDYLNARDNLAAMLAAEGKVDEALELMRQTLAMRRRLPPPLRQPLNRDLARLADLLAARGRRAEAAEYLRELAALNPGDATIRQRLEELERPAATVPAAAPTSRP